MKTLKFRSNYKLIVNNLCVNIFIFLILLVVNQNVYSQDPSPFDPVTPSSGNASGLGDAADVGVNLFTGTPSVNIPLTEIKVPHVTMPISLSYAGTGVRVNQLSGWVGLGWNLNAGGVITRQVNDLPDDWKSATIDGTFYDNVGYLYCGTTIDDIYAKGIGSLTTTEQNFMFKEIHDTEPDLYSFNIAGYAGSFVFDRDGNVKQMSKSDIKIEYVKNPSYGVASEHSFVGHIFTGSITSFTITTPDGTKYTFDQKEASFSNDEEQTYVTGTNGFEPPDNTDCSPALKTPYRVDFSNVGASFSSWYLTKVTNQFGRDVINLNYTNEIYMDHSFVAQWKQEMCTALASLQNYKRSTVQTVISKRLTSIIYGDGWSSKPYGRLDFASNFTRNDIYRPTDLSNYTSYPTPKALSLVTHSAYTSTTAYTALETFEFNYGWFNKTSITCVNPPAWLSAHRERLQLNSITRKNGTVTLPPFAFTYETTALPPRHSSQIDYWGYYNRLV